MNRKHFRLIAESIRADLSTRITMKTKYTITITPKDASTAAPFMDNKDCLLGTALQRRFGLERGEFFVGGTFVSLRGVFYKIGAGKGKIRKAYGNKTFSRPTVAKAFTVNLYRGDPDLPGEEETLVCLNMRRTHYSLS